MRVQQVTQFYNNYNTGKTKAISYTGNPQYYVMHSTSMSRKIIENQLANLQKQLALAIKGNNNKISPIVPAVEILQRQIAALTKILAS